MYVRVDRMEPAKEFELCMVGKGVVFAHLGLKILHRTRTMEKLDHAVSKGRFARLGVPDHVNDWLRETYELRIQPPVMGGEDDVDDIGGNWCKAICTLLSIIANADLSQYGSIRGYVNSEQLCEGETTDLYSCRDRHMRIVEYQRVSVLVCNRV